MTKPPVHLSIPIVIAVLSISTAAVMVKLADSAPASIIANYRLLFAVIIMAPYVLIKYRQEFKCISKKDWYLSFFAGAFLAFHFIFWFESLNYTSVASSVVLVSFQPIFAFLGTYILFQERFSAGAVISMLIAIAGSILISWGDFQLSGLAFWGDMLALAGAVMVTIYFLLGQTVRKRLSLMTYTFVVYSISSITLTVYNFIWQHSFTGYPASHWWLFLALAVVPTFFGHTLFNWTLKWVSTSTISMAVVFEPVGASILAYLIIGEQITWSQWLGGTIVISGLFLFVLSTSKKKGLVFTDKTGTNNHNIK